MSTLKSHWLLSIDTTDKKKRLGEKNEITLPAEPPITPDRDNRGNPSMWTSHAEHPSMSSTFGKGMNWCHGLTKLELPAFWQFLWNQRHKDQELDSESPTLGGHAGGPSQLPCLTDVCSAGCAWTIVNDWFPRLYLCVYLPMLSLPQSSQTFRLGQNWIELELVTWAKKRDWYKNLSSHLPF